MIIPTVSRGPLAEEPLERRRRSIGRRPSAGASRRRSGELAPDGLVDLERLARREALVDDLADGLEHRDRGVALEDVAAHVDARPRRPAIAR